jgi:predicted transcriptional regulator
LHKVDQAMMRNLRTLADRIGCTPEHLLHESIAQFVAKYEAEGKLATKIISFPKR